MLQRLYIAALLWCGFSFYAQAQLLLPKDTKMFFTLTNSVYSHNTSVGQLVDMQLYNDVIIDNQLILKAGTRATGQILECEPARGKGLPGRLSLRVNSIICKDGSEILLQSEPLHHVGQDYKTEACLVGTGACLLFPIAGAAAYWIIEGGEAHFSKETIIKGWNTQEYIIQQAP